MSLILVHSVDLHNNCITFMSLIYLTISTQSISKDPLHPKTQLHLEHFSEICLKHSDYCCYPAHLQLLNDLYSGQGNQHRSTDRSVYIKQQKTEDSSLWGM